jgi:hypothetical protein
MARLSDGVGWFSVGATNHRRTFMTKIIFAIAAISFLMTTIVPAKAHCPPGTVYSCAETLGGKMSCGCR